MIPTTIIETVLDYTAMMNYTPKQKLALKKILLEFWIFIYDKQITDENFINLKCHTNIHSNYLKHFQIRIGGILLNSDKLLDILESIKLISVNGKYSAGSFSRGYKIETSVLSFGKMTQVELNINKVFKNIRPKTHWLSKYPQYAHLIHDIYSASIRLDDYLHYLLNNIGMPLHPKTVKKTINGKEVAYVKEQFLTEAKAFQYVHMAMKINIGNIWVAEFTTGRFASSVSNMSFTATEFFQMDRSDLVDIDIKNSQPLLLAKLINCPAYKKDVEAGVFYDNMAKQICIQKKEVYTDEHRGIFKTNSYRYIFFNNNKLGSNGNIAKAMNKLYPGALDQINQLKEHGTLAGKLQRLEADIFVEFIGALNIKKLLRHDQVLITSGYVEMVKTLLTNKYKEIGLNVSFRENADAVKNMSI
jgi:hypothetical protein